MKIAVLDLGTNTFHLLIADVSKDSSWKLLHRKRVTVKLGKGGIDKNIIGGAAYLRGLNALEKFKESLDAFNIKRVFTYGTAAFRSAANGEQFLHDAKVKFRLNINVISGLEEANFIYFGVRQAVNLDEEKSLIMDIGGGSVEFIIANAKRIYWKGSFKLGAALLLEKFAPHDPLKKSDVRTLNNHFEGSLTSLIQACKKFKPQQIIGSAGSFETFSSMIRHRFPESGNHYGKTEHPILISHFRKLYKELIVSDMKQRNKMKGLIKMRVDMIVMAALLLNFVITTTKIKKMKLSAFSLKEGALWKVVNDYSKQN